MPIRNGRFINCDMRITPWILGEDALDELEWILCDYEIPYIIKMTEGYNRSVWVPRAYRRYLPNRARREISRLESETNFGRIPKEVRSESNQTHPCEDIIRGLLVGQSP